MPFIAIALSWLSLTAYGVDIGWSDSGIHGPKYDQILKQLADLHTAHPDLVSVVDYGTSVRGRTLRMVVVKRAGDFSERPAMIMSGSTHGDEYLNIEDRLPSELIQEAAADDGNVVARYVDAGGAFVFIPILNPDGYEARQRENGNGADLNRDWDLPAADFHGFKQPETRVLAHQLELMHNGKDALDYRISVDYHCCAGAVLYPWGWTDDHIPAVDLARHQKFAAMAEKELGIETGVTSDILGYHDQGTTKDYYYSKYGTTAFTYEGRYHKETGLFDKHVAWWHDMIAGVMEAPSMVPLISFHTHRKHKLIRLAD